MSAHARTAPAVPFVPHDVPVFLYYTQHSTRRCTDTTTIRLYCSRSGETRISNEEEEATLLLLLFHRLYTLVYPSRALHVCFLTRVTLKQSLDDYKINGVGTYRISTCLRPNTVLAYTGIVVFINVRKSLDKPPKTNGPKRVTQYLVLLLNRGKCGV